MAALESHLDGAVNDGELDLAHLDAKFCEVDGAAAIEDGVINARELHQRTWRPPPLQEFFVSSPPDCS